MKILLVNKFLYPKGGSETYVFKLGETLQKFGHQVEYFGLDNEKNIVGNSIGTNVSDMDFSTGIKKNLAAPFRIIYSGEAKKKMLKLLNAFQPDVIHLNNIQFHLTPSIIIAVEKYRKKAGRSIKLVYTAHDYQLVCPSHGMFDTSIRVCEKCIGGNYTHCVRTKCMKNSRMKSLLAAADAYYWKHSKAYSYIDSIICPSAFLKSKLDTQKRFADKTVAIHNFIEPREHDAPIVGEYVLEFGHLSKDKGTNTLLEVASRMPDTRFVFAGYGKAVEDMKDIPNAEYVGFKTGKELQDLIAGAAVSVCPSEMYENCPYSVMESQLLGTPALGADIGGIPELIDVGKTGELFEPGNADELELKLKKIISDKKTLSEYTENCKNVMFETPDSYYEKLMRFYTDENI